MLEMRTALTTKSLFVDVRYAKIYMTSDTARCIPETQELCTASRRPPDTKRGQRPDIFN